LEQAAQGSGGVTNPGSV